MQRRAFHIITIALGLGSLCALGQSPIIDTLVVTFPNSVQIGSQTLSAGEYTIRQLSSASNSRLLEFSTDRGTSIQASATSIPALDNNNRNDSSVLLKNINGVSRLHRIWVKGKSYGYEFPLAKDNASASAITNSELRLSATYIASPAIVATLGAEPVSELPVRAATSPAPDVRPEETPISPQAAVADAPAISAQAAAPSAPAIEPAVQATPEMPKTASSWVPLLLIGSAMLSIGLSVRTYRHNL